MKVRARDPGADRDAFQEARRGLEVQGRAVPGCDGLEPKSTVPEARGADEAIVLRARETAADVIVLGSHARDTTTHRLGSTADRV